MHSQNSWNNQMNCIGSAGNNNSMGNGNINGMMNQMNSINGMSGGGIGGPGNMPNMNGSGIQSQNMNMSMNQMQINMNPLNSQMNYSNQQRHHPNQMSQMGNNSNTNSMAGMGGGHQMNGMNQMNPMQKMQGMANGGYAARRMSPYPNPQMHTAQKRAAIYGMGNTGPQHQGPNAMNQFPHQGGVPISIQNQYTRPGQNMNMYGRTGAPPMMPSQRQNTPPYNNAAAQQYYGNATNGYPNIQGFHQQERNMNYQHSPVPGNPTPPLTPASSLTPYISPNPDIKPNIVHSKLLNFIIELKRY